MLTPKATKQTWQDRLREAVKTPELRAAEFEEAATVKRDTREREVISQALERLGALVQEAAGILNEHRPGFGVPRVGGDATLQFEDGRRLEFIGVDGGLAITVRCENNRDIDRLEVFEGALRARDEATTGNVETYFEQQLQLIVGDGRSRR